MTEAIPAMPGPMTEISHAQLLTYIVELRKALSRIRPETRSHSAILTALGGAYEEAHSRGLTVP